MGGDNSVPGTIQSHVYAGRYARFQVTIGEIESEAITEPGQVKLFGDGDTVPVRFHPDKIWVLEANSAEQPVGADSAG